MTQEDFDDLTAKARAALARLPDKRRRQAAKVLRELETKATAMLGRDVGRKKK